MMSEPKVQSYADRAEHCELMAVRVKDPEARNRFVELARRWRALAKENNDEDHT
jgi:phage terminase large subunit-like protein